MTTEREGGLELAMSLVTRSMDANFRTVDNLLEREREHRMALEVLIDVFLNAVDVAHQGTVREYERAVDIVRFKHNATGIGPDVRPASWIKDLAALHTERTGAW